MAHYYPNVEGTGNRPLLLYFPLVLADIGCCCSNLLSAMNLDRTIWGPLILEALCDRSSRTWPSTGLHTLTTCYKDPSSNDGGSYDSWYIAYACHSPVYSLRDSYWIPLQPPHYRTLRSLAPSFLWILAVAAVLECFAFIYLLFFFEEDNGG